MKKLIYLICIFALILLVSCKPNDNPQYTPEWLSKCTEQYGKSFCEEVYKTTVDCIIMNSSTEECLNMFFDNYFSINAGLRVSP